MSILITGGNGYVGSQLVNHLINADIFNDIVILDLIEPNKKLSLSEQFKNKVRFVKGGITEEDKIAESIEDATTVIHLAAIADVKKCQENPDETRKINVGGLNNILSAIKNSNVRKLVLASTMSAIYGKSQIFDESVEPSPITEYGRQKLECEKLVSEFSNKFQISSIILRKSNLYGVGIITKENVVASFVKQALKNNEIKIEGSGEQFRNFLNINDACSAYLKSISCNLESNFQIINTAGKNTTTLNELAQIVKNQVELLENIDVKISHSITSRNDDFGKIGPPEISTKKANEILGYVPNVSLEKGIKELINHYLIN